MKVKVEFRTPNALIDAAENLGDADYERLREVGNQWTRYGEFVVIEFDLDTGGARIVPPSAIPGA